MAEFKQEKMLLNDIKSKYIVKEIFSYLDEKSKLNTIIYNKQLHKLLGIDLKTYFINSGKYKIGGKNGKGAEYSLVENKLMFEGEYLNGKRNGKGKEYYDEANLEFVGEYINGKRNGTGTEYYYGGDIKFCRRIFKWRKKWKRNRILL